jgi:hypothetical protein
LELALDLEADLDVADFLALTFDVFAITLSQCQLRRLITALNIEKVSEFDI